MKMTYKQAIFKCMDYDEMMHIFEENYSEKYRLIGYRLTRINEVSHRAILIMYQRRWSNGSIRI